MKIKDDLMEHNAKAYLEIKQCFDSGEERIATERATGTGKMYIAAALSEDYGRTLFLSPNKSINDKFEQLILKYDQTRRNYSIDTYSYVAKHINELLYIKNNYDLIITDEFHRVGARTYQVAVNKLWNLNPKAKKFCTTATEIRYTDNARNMTEELGCKMVARLTLEDAVKVDPVTGKSILKKALYVTGYTDLDLKALNLESLEGRGYFTQEEKEVIKQVKKIKTNWIKTNGIYGLIDKYIPKDTKKIIVFSESIKSYHRVKDAVESWLRYAGFTNLMFLRADSKDRDRANRAIKEFSNTNSHKDKTKVIISVNMLNEGIHVEGSDVAIMLRPTYSKNILIQQMGRVHDCKCERQPVIFDIVDNLNALDVIYSYYSSGSTKMVSFRHLRIIDDCGKDSVEIMDYLNLSYIERLKEIDEKYHRLSNYEIQFEEIKAFCDKYGRTPGNSKNKDFYERKLYHQFKQLRDKGYQPAIDLWNKFYNNNRDEEIFCEAKAFYNKYDRTPTENSNDPYEKKLYRQLKRLRYKGYQPAIDLWDKYHSTDEKTFCEIKAFCDKYNKTPDGNSKDPYERKLYYQLNYLRNKSYQPAIDLWEEFHKTDEEFFCEIKAFCDKYDRTPKQDHKKPYERKLYNWFKRLRDKGYQPAIDLWNKYLDTDEETFCEIKAFCDKYNRTPKIEDPYERKLYRQFNRLRKNGYQPAIDLWDKYHNTDKETFCEIKTFCDKYDRTPKIESEDPYERKLCYHFKRLRNKGYQPAIDLWNKFQKEENKYRRIYLKIKTFCDKYGRLPHRYQGKNLSSEERNENILETQLMWLVLTINYQPAIELYQKYYGK